MEIKKRKSTRISFRANRKQFGKGSVMKLETLKQ